MTGRPGKAPMVPRRAALARISSWLDRDSRFLLVTGSMGAGKSVLLNQVTSELAIAKSTRSKWQHLAYAGHYCRADDTATISVSGLLDSWATGLSRQLPGYQENLAAAGGVQITGTAIGPRSTGVAIGTVRIAIGESPADAFARTIARPLERLADNDRLPPVLLAVDGIEEARDADGRNRVLALLAGLTGTSLPPAVRILATSRPESGVRVAFEGVEQLDLDGIGHDDVAEYVARRTTHPRLAARLVDHVRGNFLLAAETLDELDRDPRPLTGALIPAMPRTLPEVYRKRLWRMLDEHDRELLDVLGLLAVARAPLRETEIATLLGLDRHLARAAVNRLLPVLVHDRSTGRHRLVHKALAEFLLDPDENTLPVRSAGSLHAAIATRIHGDWADAWESCDEPYAIHHIAAHLALAVTTAENARRAREAQDLLGHLVGDPGFLHAKAAAAGVDGVHADLTYATSALPDKAADIRELDRLLLRQAHHLRDWEPRRFPGLFIQQLQHEAVVTGNEALAEVLSGHLERDELAHLRMHWARTPLSRQLTLMLTGHRAAIIGVAVTPDGMRAITGAEDATARVWELDTGRTIHTLDGHDGPVTCVAVSPDGTMAATGAADGTARVWDLDTGRLIHVLAGADDRLSAAAFTADGRLVTASWDRAVRIWNVHTGQLVHLLKGHQGRIEGLTLTAEGYAVTVSGDGTRRSWDIKAGRLVDTQVHQGTARSFAARVMTADGTRTITSYQDGTAQVRVVNHLEKEPCPGAHHGKINAMVPTLGRRRLITASDDGTARMWSAATGRLLSTMAGHRDWVISVAASADGTLAVTTSWDGTVLVWDLPAGRRLHTLSRHRDHVTAVAMMPDGSLAVTTSWDQTARVWDLRAGRRVHTLRGHDGWVGAVAVLPNTSRAITAAADGTARIWNLTTGEVEHVCTGHRGEITALAVTGMLAVTASRDGTARVWDLSAGDLMHVLAGHEGAVTHVAVDGGMAVTGSDDGTAAVWDLRSGEQRHTIEGHGGPVTAVACGAGRVVTASTDRTIRLWTPEGVQCAGLPDPATCLAVHAQDLTVGTATGGLFRYGLRTTATPKGRSAALPDGS